MIYASTGNLKCYECGDVGHKKIACPHNKTHLETNANDIEVIPSVQTGENVEIGEEPNKTIIDGENKDETTGEGTSYQKKRNSTGSVVGSGRPTEKRENVCVGAGDGDNGDEEGLSAKLPKVVTKDAQDTGQNFLSQSTDFAGLVCCF